MTVLIIGGKYQGKTDLAKRLFNLTDDDFINGCNLTDNNIKSAKAISDLQEYTKKIDSLNFDLHSFVNSLKDKIIICTELGCGVVPMQKELDDWREITGRICCEIASISDVVIRVTAGLPQIIKGKVEF